ncbi:Calx-beta domain-containing protein [Amycolatopsis decaplanina]|uniref:Type 1 secretion C-terminal target domain containing protein n=1 Tax=Amycolatopsis decaplanina DSM 44594 TaxID=1284240 RepID=M2YEJ6_9PSEU|nr:Calx-beta domain-containing protein [Amycolatopsis decaplanina]EME53297.1 type 1 secretion C-terminal target domain containing protein [Amycolatopsis decaplanina DSM 44594]
MRRTATLGAALAVTFGLAIPAAEGGEAGCTAPVANVSGVSQAEGTSAGYTTFLFTVSLDDGGCAPQGSVEYRTIEGNGSSVDPAFIAKENVDYLPSAGTLTWSGTADTRTVAVKVRADSFAENDEMFSLRLYGEKGVRIGHSVGVAWVADDDTVKTAPLATTQEGEICWSVPPNFAQGSSCRVPLVLSRPWLAGPLTIRYRTEGSAHEPVKDGVVTFQRGETRGYAEFTIVPGQTGKARVEFFDPSQGRLVYATSTVLISPAG